MTEQHQNPPPAPTRWTSEALLAEWPERGTKIYADGYRTTMRRMADEVAAVRREYEGHLADQRFEGDRPWDRKLRARAAVRPLVLLEKHLRAGLVAIGYLDPAYQRHYVDAPAKRRAIIAARLARKQRRLGITAAPARPAITGPNLVQQLGQDLAGGEQQSSFMGMLQGQQGDAYRRQA